MRAEESLTLAIIRGVVSGAGAIEDVANGDLNRGDFVDYPQAGFRRWGVGQGADLLTAARKDASTISAQKSGTRSYVTDNNGNTVGGAGRNRTDA